MAIDTAKLQSTLHQLVSGTSDIEGAALVTTDGLPLVSALPGHMDEERVSAMSAAMLSLSERIGHELIRGGINQIAIDGAEGTCMLTSCGEDAVLLVLANRMVKKGILNLEVKRVLGDLRQLLM